VSVAEVRFLAAAYDDVESAYVWYEHQHAGLGAEFACLHAARDPELGLSRIHDDDR
jgi:hypothetical protein